MRSVGRRIDVVDTVTVTADYFGIPVDTGNRAAADWWARWIGRTPAMTVDVRADSSPGG